MTRSLWLLSIALLPFGWFPRFPWLHAHAQWSDAVLAAAALSWLVLRIRARSLPRPGALHACLALYVGGAALSLATAPGAAAGNPWKLIGIAALVCMLLLTSDLASVPGARRGLAWAVALSGLLTAACALSGVLLHTFGLETPLVGPYGDLVPGPYARARAFLLHPNLYHC